MGAKSVRGPGPARTSPGRSSPAAVRAAYRVDSSGSAPRVRNKLGVPVFPSPEFMDLKRIK